MAFGEKLFDSRQKGTLFRAFTLPGRAGQGFARAQKSTQHVRELLGLETMEI